MVTPQTMWHWHQWRLPAESTSFHKGYAVDLASRVGDVGQHAGWPQKDIILNGGAE